MHSSTHDVAYALLAASAIISLVGTFKGCQQLSLEVKNVYPK
jgi:hypothetical protein